MRCQDSELSMQGMSRLSRENRIKRKWRHQKRMSRERYVKEREASRQQLPRERGVKRNGCEEKEVPRERDVNGNEMPRKLKQTMALGSRWCLQNVFNRKNGW